MAMCHQLLEITVVNASDRSTMCLCVCVCVYTCGGEARVVCADVHCGEFHVRYHLCSRLYLGEFVQLSVFYLLLNSCPILLTVNPDLWVGLCRSYYKLPYQQELVRIQFSHWRSAWVCRLRVLRLAEERAMRWENGGTCTTRTYRHV